MPLSLRASILLAAGTTIGCSAPVVDDVADANGAMTEGVVVVERMVGDGATQTNISAKFMRLSTPVDPDLAERLVGSKLDLPAAGVCRASASGVWGQSAARDPSVSSVGAAGKTGSSSARSALGTIELIDVGDVSLRAGGAVMPLAVRAFPDVGDLVSGMFYTSPDAASDLPAGATYTLEGTGSGLVEHFAVDAEAPPALEDVRIGSASLTDGVALDEGVPVTVQWRAAVETGRTRSQPARADLVLIDVSAASGASIRCAFRDEGKAVVPGWVLRGATLGALPATATFAVHRVRERAFASPGLDAGEVRFDLSVTGRAVVSVAAPGVALPGVALPAASPHAALAP